MLDGERFLKHLPSTIAASCVYASLRTLGFGSCVSVIAVTAPNFTQILYYHY